jgi:hypothetical protein
VPEPRLGRWRRGTHVCVRGYAFAMNFGMFWMSTGLLVAILPYFALFAV